MSDELMELPEGWVIEKIKDLCSFNPKHDKEMSDTLEISFVPMSNVSEVTGTIQTHDRKPLGEVRKGYTHFAENDVIFAKITPCMENGKVAVARNLINGIACGSTEFHVLRSYGAVIPDYLHSFLRQRGYLDIASGEMTGVVGQRRLPKDFLLETELPLPPLNEQKRIVDTIAQLRERSQKARSALSAIPELCDKFQQSVLAAAFQGDLTADWREQNPDVEPASVLLERIGRDRRNQWEKSELEKIKVSGKLPKDDQWKAKYKQPKLIESFDLPTLPNGWVWSCIEEIVINYDHIRIPVKADDRRLRQGVYPYYGAFGIIDQVDHYLFDGNYLLIAEDGKNLLYRNKPIAFLANGKFWVNNHAHVVQTLGGLSLEYLEAYMNSIDLTFHLVGIDQVKLTRGALDRIPVPIAPLEEQLVMLSQIRSSLSTKTGISQISEIGLSLIAHLDRSILAKAFRGELVEQDPSDEPASVLLDRIRNEREQQAQEKAKKPGKRGQSKKKAESP